MAHFQPLLYTTYMYIYIYYVNMLNTYIYISLSIYIYIHISLFPYMHLILYRRRPSWPRSQLPANKWFVLSLVLTSLGLLPLLLFLLLLLLSLLLIILLSLSFLFFDAEPPPSQPAEAPLRREQLRIQAIQHSKPTRLDYTNDLI